jgi:dTDP-4-dehydrorhamnose reductase
VRVLVTGCNGQVGRSVTSLGQTLGFIISSCAREALDITSKSSITDNMQKFKPDLVINAAAYTAVDKAESDVELAFMVNKQGVINLAHACEQADIPLFHISTDYVFDGMSNQPYRETDIVSPLSVYGKSKEAGESALRSILKKHIVLRTSWVFSEFGANFPKTILRLASEKDKINIVADQFGGPTSSKSIARVLCAIAQIYESKKDLDWGTYHFTQQPHVSWYQFAEEIIRQAHEKNALENIPVISKISTEDFPSVAKRPLDARLECSAINEAFGISASEWYSDVGDLIDACHNPREI